MRRTGLVMAAVLVAVAAGMAVPGASPPTDAASAAAHTVASPATPGGNGSAGTPAVRRAENAAIVNANPDELPPGCSGVAGERNVTVGAGRAHADAGEMFAYDTDAVRVAPCTRLTVTLVNRDHVRHQWMVHGLPRETYPMGMFTIEVTGPAKATGTFIVPGTRETLRVHCSLPQHEQKGMHAELIVGSSGEGSTDAPGEESGARESGLIVAAAAGAALAGLLARRYG